MKKDYLLLIVSVVLSLIVSLAIIRELAPSLLGFPDDLVLVQSSEEVVPFYEVVFDVNAHISMEALLKDPGVVNRAHPLYPDRFSWGPNDILGFRNRSVPNRADIVIIGDSQTYGDNAPLAENWPSYFSGALYNDKLIHYSMATGGWGPVQYLDMMYNAPLFMPKAVIVAFYTGNDPLEGFIVAYGVDRWKSLRLDSSLDKGDAPTFVLSNPSDPPSH